MTKNFQSIHLSEESLERFFRWIECRRIFLIV